MKAAWFEKFGEAKDTLVFGDLEKPIAKKGEVLVRMKTTGVNPSDVKKRAGSAANLLDDGLVIPHSDGAGIIEAVGEGVDAGRVGERVWVYQAQYGRQLGTAAEYLAIDASRAAFLPENASFEIGACLGIPVMTAHRAVFLRARTALGPPRTPPRSRSRQPSSSAFALRRLPLGWISNADDSSSSSTATSNGWRTP